jgi:hypothetical protein
MSTTPRKPKGKKPSRAAKPFVMIIECMEADDPGSEGRFVKHMLDLMRIPNRYRKAKDQAEFIEVLSTFSSEADVVHITTHGEYEETKSKRDRFTGFATPRRAVTIDAIKAAGIDLAGKTVLSTACFSGQKAAREAFKKATGCQHYIAPIRDPHFHNAALMCHIFYHKHLILKRSVKKAFREYEGRYKNPHVFCLL